MIETSQRHHLGEVFVFLLNVALYGQNWQTAIPTTRHDLPMSAAPHGSGPHACSDVATHLMKSTDRRSAPVDPTTQGNRRMDLESPTAKSASCEVASTHATQANAVAIVGMACRFPGAPNLAAFWELLLAGGDAVTEVPADRFDINLHHSASPATPGRTVSRHGGFLADIFGFDADFFGISPIEARAMDPQQRLLLHVAWEALENAGLPPAEIRGTRTGVFVGQATAEYAQAAYGSDPDIRAVTGSQLRAMAAGRLSFALDLRGPSVTVDTACSSSLVTVHLARQSLLAGECDTAIVGGVNVILSPHDSIAYSQAGMLSPGGKCRFGAASADGFVRSEGIGVVVLRRLADTSTADRVPAIIRGSAANNDGRSGGLLLQPAVAGQAEMLRAAYASAGVKPSDVDYIEAHGTGTKIGDAVELSALAEVVADGRPPQRPCVVGSVKSNIGHAEAAAGLAGLMKCVLVLQHRTVPASLHCDEPLAMLTASAGPLEISHKARNLSGRNPLPLVGVSAFGLSGTNAHVVLSGPERGGVRRELERPETRDAPAAMLSLSASSADRLRVVVADWRDFLVDRDSTSSPSLSDVCFTAAVRRQPQSHRLVASAGSFVELAEQLSSYLAGRSHSRVTSGYAGASGQRRTVFVFSGQGGQWTGMGRQLYEAFPAYRASFDCCDAAALPYLGRSLKDLLTLDEPVEAIEWLQPLLWALQVAMAQLWRSWGVEPGAVIGHSMGEVAAAQIAGALSMTQAAEVICRRSAAMARAGGGGAMIWTDLSADDARDLVAREPAVFIAADNSPRSRVLAGAASDLDRTAVALRSGGTTCRSITVNVASHTPYMSAAAQALRDELHALQPSAAALPFFSTCRPGELDGGKLSADYWADNLRDPVRFADGLSAILRDGECVLVEISPHPVLQPSLAELQRSFGHTEAVVSCARRSEDEVQSMIGAVRALHTLGGEVTWGSWFSESCGLVQVPGQPLRNTPYRAAGLPKRALTVQSCDVRLQQLGMANGQWRSTVGGIGMVPGAAYLAAALRVARDSDTGAGWDLEEVRFHEAYLVGPGSDPVLRVSSSIGDGEAAGLFSIAVVDAEGRDTAGAPVCVTGRVLRRRQGDDWGGRDLESALDRCRKHVSKAAFDRVAASYALTAGEQSPRLLRAWRGRAEAVATFALHPAGMHSEPMVVEGGLQVLLLALPQKFLNRSVQPWIPLKIAAVRILGYPADTLWSSATLRRSRSSSSVIADVRMFDQAGRPMIELLGIELTKPRYVASSPTMSSENRTTWQSIGRRPRESSQRAVMTLAGATRRAMAPWRLPQLGTDLAPVVNEPSPDGSVSVAVQLPVRADFIDSLAKVLGTTRAGVDPTKSPREMGLDSLLAIQLRAILHAEAGHNIPAETLLGYQTVRHITEDLANDHDATGSRNPASMISNADTNSFFNADGFVPAPT